ncbi:MAG: Gfo/Idh/MocA family protein [Xanthobacteraceae bacterium]
MIRLAVLGTSEIVRRAVLRPLRQMSEFDVRVLLIGRDAERTARFAAENGVTHWSTSRDKALSNAEVDAAYIALPNILHAETTANAARAGLDVLVEKPICLCARELAQVTEAAETSGSDVVEAVMVTHHPWLAYLAKLQASHGPILRTRTELWFQPTADRLQRIPPTIEGGGILYDVSPYWLAITQQTAGLDVVDCSIRVIHAGLGRDLEVEARVELRSGGIVDLSAGYGRFRAMHEVVFERAIARVENFLRPAVGNLMLGIIITRSGREPENILFDAASYYATQLRDFIESHSSGRRGAAGLVSAAARMQVIERLLPSLLRQVRA